MNKDFIEVSLLLRLFKMHNVHCNIRLYVMYTVHCTLYSVYSTYIHTRRRTARNHSTFNLCYYIHTFVK